ncbi:hypothetical protein PROFUN_13035 [Planoprotostelium fungivorum]|uniref:Uncharacterized protein n=1 Tax=Planoprotostelium fungivorum TaxID=1890364 RepID=A0A2P6N5L5_9EUKA|nr:hypothetical protein PROFUN_13035 [Planoprotostelium fungivorum]
MCVIWYKRSHRQNRSLTSKRRAVDWTLFQINRPRQTRLSTHMLTERREEYGFLLHHATDRSLCSRLPNRKKNSRCFCELRLIYNQPDQPRVLGGKAGGDTTTITDYYVKPLDNYSIEDGSFWDKMVRSLFNL